MSLVEVDVALKLLSLDDLPRRLAPYREAGQRIIHCHGVFDLIHPGHVRHLQAARRLGDVLVVTITADAHVARGPGRPVFNERLRSEVLAAFEFVDFVCVVDEPTAVPAIHGVRPDTFVKGMDYANPDDDVTGMIEQEREAVEAGGGRLEFTDEITFSSSALLNRHFTVFPQATADFLSDFRQRYDFDYFQTLLDRMRDFRVLVVGDAIIDEYAYCGPLGRSSKEMILSTRLIDEETFAGGSLALANHLSALVGQVDLVTALGATDSREAFIREHLGERVRPTFLYRDDGPTTTKRRYVERAFLKKLFQVSAIEDRPMPENTRRALIAHLQACAGEYDMVVVADFGHGLLDDEAVDVLSREATFLAVNAQTNSANHGFNPVTRYRHANFACIDEPELRVAERDRWTPVEELAPRLIEQMGCERMIITRGHEGCIVYSREGDITQVPVFSGEVVDRVGAGDAFFGIAGPAARLEQPSEVLGFLGNAVGAMAVRVVGNRTALDRTALLKYITTLLK